MDNKKVAGKNYFCVDCDYITCKKSSWTKHLNTKKHKKNINKIAEKSCSEYVCNDCGKKYKSYVGLWKHKKKCSIKNSYIDLSKNNTNIKDMANAINNIVKEVKKMKPQTINNNCINKQSISINVFLNERCKNAMNLTDFIDNIQFSLDDVISAYNIGYPKSTANVFIKGLEEMPLTKRPIHCTDEKRGTLYIKDNNKWEKDGCNKTMEHLDKLRTKSYLGIIEWEKSNPNWINDPEKMKERCKLVESLTGGLKHEEIEQNQKKLLREISSKILIKDQLDNIEDKE